MLCTVQHCCCGCSLKTGTIILLILSTLGSVFQFLGAFSGKVKFFTIFVSLVAIAVCAAGFYGIREENPAYVLPFAVLQFLGAVSCVFLALISIVARQFVIDWLKESAKEQGTPYKPEDLQNLNSAFIIVIISFLFAAALEYYFFVVVYSFYKKLQEDKRSPVVHA